MLLMPMSGVLNCLFSRGIHLRNLTARMSSTYLSYEEAMHKLNSLQSNKASLEQIKRDIKTGKKCTNLEEMEDYLLRCGISLNKLDTMSVIHIAGTKGKGSTSAMCESILRHHGYKTGFFSSPHLVSVCERIRLDGQVIDKNKFTDCFHKVYNLLDNSKSFVGDMPKYFAFLTVLAYNIFLQDKVDVAIIEVGIGGAVDYTNVLRKVPIVGITALGLDHTSILGNTIEEIAIAKAGIMKPGCQAYTVEQTDKAMKVLYEVAKVVECPLHIAPDYTTYMFPNNLNNQLPVELEAFCMNASLAIQLAHAWMRITHTKNTVFKINNGKRIQKKDKIISQFGYKNVYRERKSEGEIVNTVPMNTLLGLLHCKWPGRYQIIRSDYANFFLDGAHTKESMKICADWYSANTGTGLSGKHDKTLLFSATGDRDAETLLTPLKDIAFQTVFFVIPAAYKEISDKNDNYSAIENRDLISRCQKNADVWHHLHKSSYSQVIVLECVEDALKLIKSKKSFTSVLVTGSLHLVGAALSILDSNLSAS